MGPETRYALSGDVHIAYQVVGEGPLDLIFIPGFVTHVRHVGRARAPAATNRQLSFAHGGGR